MTEVLHQGCCYGDISGFPEYCIFICLLCVSVDMPQRRFKDFTYCRPVLTEIYISLLYDPRFYVI